MKIWLRKPVISFLKYQEKHSSRPPRYVLILAHMRSGSTLLNHILMSHADILGCGERNAAYTSADDLALLRFHAHYHRKQFFKPYRYFVDQINHNQFIQDADFLNHPRIMKIFLIREPAASVTSMVKVLGKYYGTTLEQSVAYYTERLPRLAAYAQALQDARQAFFLTYDDLIQHTNASLLNLQKFLDLPTPLSEQYQTFEFTGKQGDPGENIQRGSIYQAASPDRLDIPCEDLAKIQQAYEHCFDILKAHCIPGNPVRGI